MISPTEKKGYIYNTFFRRIGEDSIYTKIDQGIRTQRSTVMYFKHTNRPGFLLGLIDFCTAGMFFLLYMPLGGLQDELDYILGRKTQRYWVAYLLGVPTLFIYTLVWMARISEELKAKAIEMGIEGPHTSWWHMFGWNVFGLLLFGPAVATHRFFNTLNKVEIQMNKRADATK